MPAGTTLGMLEIELPLFWGLSVRFCLFVSIPPLCTICDHSYTQPDSDAISDIEDYEVILHVVSKERE